MITNVRIYSKHHDNRGRSIWNEIQKTFGSTGITKIEVVKKYYLEGFSAQTADYFATTVLTDALVQRYVVNEITAPGVKKIEIAQKQGVMNPEIATLFKAATDLKLSGLTNADTSWEYYFYGNINDEQLQLICHRLLMNATIEYIVHENNVSDMHLQPSVIATVPIRSMTDAELVSFAQLHQLYLNINELTTIKNYFIQNERDPYDIEVETIAQTWSEHCYHKTFKAPLIINGVAKKSLFSRLKETAQKFSDNVVSAFVDNAGAFHFYEGYAVLGKVETHNSPSAIEPYGGAATGSGGVFRDILGTGHGAKIIAATDMFCFAPPDLPRNQIPSGCLAPEYLLRKVVAGVGDYGNRMGIPTNNGSVHFHEDFRAKPTVIVGAYGIAPEIQCHKGVPLAEDFIVLVGGRTGRDGIHGATFSSGTMTAATMSTNAHAVQIGNPIEEKRLIDAIICARDAGIIKALTDCGAGGLSSAIGEMAADSGAHVSLEKVPLKYQPLHPREIWVSESQERMVCAISPEHVKNFQEICAEYNVDATVIGIFTDRGQLEITFHEQLICNLSMQFLHHGLPQKKLIGSYTACAYKNIDMSPPHDWVHILCAAMAEWNICSKEPIVRLYDHGVQASNALMSFTGVHEQGPNDAVVLTPLLGKPYGLVISHGMNPALMERDPYHGSWWAITEALANLTAVGGNVQETCLIDNFIWPCPDEQYIGFLDAALQACIDAMETFKIPFISGKDSLSSSYQHPDGKILNIPPVLCISAFGKIPNVSITISSDFKHIGSCIVLIGNIDMEGIGGSVYAKITHQDSPHYRIPHINQKQLPLIFQTVHELINANIIHACHDISEGGIAVALAEMCIGGAIGAHGDLTFLKEQRADLFLFSETAGCFLAEVKNEDLDNPLFASIPHQIIGKTVKKPIITMEHTNKVLFQIEVSLLQQCWQRPMKEIFNP